MENQTDQTNFQSPTQPPVQPSLPPTNMPPISNRKNNSISLFWVAIAVVLTFYIGVAWGKKHSPSGDQLGYQTPGSSQSMDNFLKNLSSPKELFQNTDTNKPKGLDFDIFWKAWQEVSRKYVDEGKVDPQKMVYGAIKGMIASIGDPYSGFMDPNETKDFNSDMEGSFEGIGAELGIKDGILTVIAPIEGMPAQKAGIRSGDKILKIDGKMTNDLSVEDAVKFIRGKKGTEVTLTIVRNGDSKTQEIKVKRDKIEIKSVIYEKKEGSIAYIRITKFAEDTSREFNTAVAQAIADGSRGVVVDVRNNPGGFLNAAVEIASKFIPKGQVVVWEKGRDGQKTDFKALGGDSMSEVPVMVLMNEGSASASEILAGALRDDKGAKLIGKKSFGKGSVQQLEKMEDGSSLRITIAKWLTPSEQSIHEVGLSPDIEVDFTEDDAKNMRDPQLERALQEMKNVIK